MFSKSCTFDLLAIVVYFFAIRLLCLLEDCALLFSANTPIVFTVAF